MQLKNTNIKVFELIAAGAKTFLNDKFVGDVDSRSLMNADKVVAVALKGLENDKLEIYSGLANVIKIMSRIDQAFY